MTIRTGTMGHRAMAYMTGHYSLHLDGQIDIRFHSSGDVLQGRLDDVIADKDLQPTLLKLTDGVNVPWHAIRSYRCLKP